MKILVVTPEWPDPPDQGGRTRMSNLLKCLSRSHSITLVSVVDSPLSSEQRSALDPYVQHAHIVYHPNSYARTFLRIARSLVTGSPYILDRYCPASLTHLLDRLIAETRSSTVFLAAHYLTESAAQRFDLPVIVDFHDITHVLYDRFARSRGLTLKKWHGRIQYQRMRRFEASIPHRVAACTTTSTEDAETLAQVSGASNIHVVPNGVDTVFYSPQFAGPTESHGLDMVFVGSFDYAPNVQGARFLYNEVMPLVWDILPDARVGLVGRDPALSVRRLTRDPRVHVTGRVSDVRTYLAHAKAVVVPLQVGGGTRLKILEAMAMAKPVVSTRLGCEGIQVSDGVNILIADTPRDMARAIVRLLLDPEQQRRVGQSGRHLVETTYDWNIVGQQLEHVLGSALISEARCG